MVRPEAIDRPGPSEWAIVRRKGLTGESPVVVGAAAPRSRLPAIGEIRPVEAEHQVPGS